MINTLEKFICEFKSIHNSVTFSGRSDFDGFLTTIKKRPIFRQYQLKFHIQTSACKRIGINAINVKRFGDWWSQILHLLVYGSK